MADGATACRSKLLEELRTARNAAGMTQAQVATELGCEQARVNKLETGKTKLQRRDLDIMLRLYDVPPDQARTLRTLHQAAQAARPVNATFMQMLELESHATEILVLRSERIPQLLQAETYLLKQYECAGALTDPASLLLERENRAQIFEGADPPWYRAILSESSLHRMPGGRAPALVIDQASHLLSLIETYERLSVQVLTFAAPIAYLDPDVTILKFKGRKDVAYAEFATEGRIYRAAKVVTEREAYWRHVQEHALSREDTRKYLEDLIEEAEAGWRHPADT